MVYRVACGLVFAPFLHLGVEGLAAPLPLVGAQAGPPALISTDAKLGGVAGRGIMREAALAVWLGGMVSDLIHLPVPCLALVVPVSNDTPWGVLLAGSSIMISASGGWFIRLSSPFGTWTNLPSHSTSKGS